VRRRLGAAGRGKEKDEDREPHETFRAFRRFR
jgi:hypothetical protein